MIFKSKRSKYFIVMLLAILGGLTSMCIAILFSSSDLAFIIPVYIICFCTGFFLLWIYWSTHYTLTQNHLIYRSGPITGKIELTTIFEIVIGQKFFAGLKPATGNNGLVIKYNRWDELYISPQTNETFIKEILKRNTKIKITTL